MKIINLTLTTLFLLSCAEGIKPPNPTVMAEIKDGLEYIFGHTDPCYNANETEKTCQTKDFKKAYPPLKVKLKPFAIDRHEVTNFQYQYCVAMGDCEEPKGFNAAVTENYYLSSEFKNYPVIYLSKEMAEAYCKFAGKRLPTEFEWERVAGGPAADLSEKRKYTYQGVTQIKQCQGKSIAVYYCNNQKDNPQEVMSSADDVVSEGGADIFDLGGNVAEWVGGKYNEEYAYVACAGLLPATCDCFLCKPQDTQCNEDCRKCPECESEAELCYKQCVSESESGYPICIKYDNEPVEAETLVKTTGNKDLARGGSYIDWENNTCRSVTYDRYWIFPSDSGKNFIGFRCAKDL
ncbi:MAG: formylglycine-generating enzyme family protein [Deltaproteobacteria bacterium]|nr:formylglycine-generating enzyme family protein [Deltaproteobacteria bacterium]